MNRYTIIEIDNEGNKTASIFEYETYEIACTMQEILETLYPEYGFLVYTLDEWVTECERNA